MMLATEIGAGQLADLVKQVQAGNEVLLTQNNKPVAKLVSASEKTVYRNSGVAYAPLAVLDDNGQALPYTEIPSQIGVGTGEVAPGASVVLADKIDLNQHYAIPKPGKYVVQFSGAGLEIGQPIPSRNPGLFGEEDNVIMPYSDFVPATNRFPSEFITIEVIAGPGQ
jgi:prevent-host-death family protein